MKLITPPPSVEVKNELSYIAARSVTCVVDDLGWLLCLSAWLQEGTGVVLPLRKYSPSAGSGNRNSNFAEFVCEFTNDSRPAVCATLL